MYDKEYFIKKFEAIPEEEIGKGSLCDHCALWHCGVVNYRKLTEEAIALNKLFIGTNNHFVNSKYGHVISINDHRFEFGKTPKQRILNKLRSL